MISILSNLNLYGSLLESDSISNHHWVAVIDEATCNGFFVLVACRKCGMLARKLNSNTWESSKPSSNQWETHSYSSEECSGCLKEIDC